MPALRLVVRGRVQGVGYRAFAVAAARRLGLAGWVRNRRDGSVEMVAAGEEAAVAALRAALPGGPGGVEGLESSPWDAPVGPGFTVLPTA